jgi:undecaprenyl-diphosphatase
MRPVAAPLAIFGIMLLVAGLCLWRGFARWDDELYHLMRLDPAGPYAPIAIVLTRIGGAAALIPVGLLAIARLAMTGRMRVAIWLFATIASGRILVELIKIAVHRPRPLLVERLVLVDSASFPSSHSAGAMLTGLALVIAFDRGPRELAAAMGFAAAVGLSRIGLGVHWPSDVLAGWGYGLLWTGGAILLADRKP